MSTTPPTATELPKAYSPAAVEPLAAAIWDAGNLFHAEPTDSGKPYAIVIPPPNVTAALHVGHALNDTLQDILIRWHRMLGDNTCWLPGTDHAGIATQTVVEKRVLAEEGKRRTDFTREQFVQKIQAWKDQYEARITAQLKAMGCSCDWQRQAFTMDEPRAQAVREAFFRLFRDGLIYRGKRLVNWDPATQTALADDEVEMEEIDGHFYYLRYPLVAEGKHSGELTYVTVATTRPETMLGDTAVAINPNDPRAALLRGRKVRLPIVDRIIPIIEDDYVVLPDPDSDDPKARYATGFLKVTPAHDPNDYDLGQRHKLPIVNVLAPDGSVSDQHGWSDVGGAEFVLGLDRYEAREAIVEWFRRNRLLEEVKPYRHSVGHSYRSHVAIEPYLSDQWYVATRAPVPSLPDEGLIEGTEVSRSSLAGLALRAMTQHGGELRFFPDRYARTFETWHQNIRDWCISRQLWWGHRIPAWSIEGQVDWDMTAAQAERFRRIACERQIAGRTYVCLLVDDAQIIGDLERMGFTQDPDVLDTWFSSALWPLSTLNWPADTPELRAWNPSDTLCTAREIITLWVSRMVMFNLYLRRCLPFRDVYIHAMIQDGEGRKMSKTLGNGVDPLDIIQSHGADAMRFTLTMMTTNTQDVRMPVERDPATGRNTSPKFDIGRNFCNKLWNASRFALANLAAIPAEPVDESRWELWDHWIVSRLGRTVAAVDVALASYNFDEYARACYDFFWRDLCDWYIEAIKPRLKGPGAGQAAAVLAAALDAALRLMHPMVPFITEVIYGHLHQARSARGLPGRLLSCASPRLIRAAWPRCTHTDHPHAEALVERLQQVISTIRNVRNEYKVDPRRSVTVSLRAEADLAPQLAANSAAIELLAVCTLKDIRPELAAIPGAAHAAAGGCDIFVEGLADADTERQRQAKKRQDLERQIATLRGRLANPSYASKAPPHLVHQTRDQLAAAEAELARLADQ